MKTEKKDKYAWLSDRDLIAEGKRFAFWETEKTYARTIFVDGQAPSASDDNDGSEERPLKTISRAAELAQPGTKVVIAGGVYRETVRPGFSGTKDAPICFCARGGERVVVSGARPYQGEYVPDFLWRKDCKEEIYRLSVCEYLEDGYNPFALNQFPNDLVWLSGRPIDDLQPFLLSRGRVRADGEDLLQVYSFWDLCAAESGFCTEKDGRYVYIKLKGGEHPQGKNIELVVAEQLFCPKERGFSYIKVEGIEFEDCANCFPVPQTGALSANRGHHFVFENNTVRRAEGIALEVGNQSWGSSEQGEAGHNVIRGNRFYDIGICAIASFGCKDTLIEDNYIENAGWKEVEFMGENAAIKVHLAHDCLIRRNHVRHTEHALGIWLDYENTDCRVSENILEDLSSGNGGVMFEATHEQCVLDNNVFYKIRNERKKGEDLGCGGNGFMAFGTDKSLVFGNLFYGCDGPCVFVNMVRGRIVGTRGGIGCKNVFRGNLFAGCGRSAAEIPHENNEFGDNVYSPSKGGYIRIGTHDRPYTRENAEPDNIRLDLEAFQSVYGKDKGSVTETFSTERTEDGFVFICGKRGRRILESLSALEVLRVEKRGEEYAVTARAARVR